VPTYQYACTECGYGFDAVQSFTDDALTECPQCGGRLRKVFGTVGIVFKGSGFYRNDSRDAAKAATGGDGKGDTKKDGGKTSDGAASDSKPAESSKPAAKAAAGSSTGGAGSSSSSAASTGGSSGSAA
jgi:putative FmdB family regulatory protein